MIKQATFCLLVLLFFSCVENEKQQEQEVISSKDKPALYIFCDKLPRFPGGNKLLVEYIESNIKWPKKFDGASIAGIVDLIFVITDEGHITDVRVINGLHPDFDKEAIRLIETMPKWEAGVINGKNVSVLMYLPIMFELK